ncbi:CDP-alcohol phosphatidyltransferase family protein [Candidatus Woesearchaeota archaeon]|nr:CDP-alcohol phosphatidyltransferase family protein [Candidatus Woesearchaeota archaeon]
MNLANLLTTIRISLIPIILYLIVKETYLGSLLAMVLFLLSLVLDYFDGYVAKKRGEESKIGSFLDPFAGKLLASMVLFIFFLKGLFGFWPWLLLIVRDLSMGWVLWLSSQDDIFIPEKKMLGKIILQSQMLLVFSLLLELIFYAAGFNNLNFTRKIVSFFTILVLIMAFVSLIISFFIYINALINRKKEGRKLRKEKLIVLANRKSRGYHDSYRRHLLKIFTKRRGAELVYLPHRKEMFSSLLKKINSNKPVIKEVILAGGDGTFESALNEKLLWNKNIGFFPLGRGNLYYSYFYKGKRFEYLRSRFPFYESKIDILELEWDKGKVQTCLFSLGIDAEVMNLAESKNGGFYDYFKAGFNALLRSKSNFNFNIVSGKNTKNNTKKKHISLNNCQAITFGKVPYFGFGLRGLLGRVNPIDGQVYGLAVVNTHGSWLNKPARFWALILANFIQQPRAPFFSLKEKEFFIESKDNFPLQAGGDFLGYTRWVRVKVVRQQKVLMV